MVQNNLVFFTSEWQAQVQSPSIEVIWRQSNHNTITSATENTTTGVVLSGGDGGADFVNLGNDVIQNVVIIYTDILDSLRGSLTQELNKTANFNQGRPRQNYQAQIRPNEVAFASSPSLRLIPDTEFTPDPLTHE